MDISSGENIVSPAVNGGEEDDKMNMSGGGGNRWPRQETLALLKIRSDMDGVFRDSSLKGPLWEEVSRKLGELGYHRSSKKCKEKFENVYKYHKRTKEGRSGKSEGKTYRFFDELQALEKKITFSSTYPPKPLPNNNTLSLPPTMPNIEATKTISHVTNITIPSKNPTTLVSPSPPPPTPPPKTTNATTMTNPSSSNNVSYSLPNMNVNLFSTTTTSTSSSTASDEDLEEKYRKKRKWKDYFRRLTREVLAKQEDMQKKFLEAIDKREKEHMAQQDALRVQEMARINKEHELLVQERSSAAQKNAAVIAFLQKLSGQPPPPQPPQPPPPPPASELSLTPVSQIQTQQLMIPNNNIVEIQNMNNGHKSACDVASPSRWPKSEVHALIRIRTSLEPKYQENGPKAPLWEDISAGMKKLGYNRNAKRCKEKWENINKYYKKMKESNKQRRDDSKTCPYFHELEALYKEKNKLQNPFVSNSFHSMKSSEMMEPLMVQPEQQWRPPTQYEEAHAVKNNNNNNEEKQDDNGDVDDEEDDNMDDYEDGDSMEEDEGGVSSRYEVVTNKLPPMNTV